MAQFKKTTVTTDELEDFFSKPQNVLSFVMGQFVDNNGYDPNEVVPNVFNKGTETFWKGKLWTEWKEDVFGLGLSTDDFNLVLTACTSEIVEIYMIEAKTRNKGIGTDIMNKILDIADEFGITIKLVPSPYKNINDEKYYNFLREWYRSFGFIGSQFGPTMKYVPKK